MESVAQSRHWLTGQLVLSGRDHRSDEAALCISELAANAVDHTGDGFRVQLSDVDGPLRVAVSDSDATLPVVLAVDPDAERGRGLIIVDAIAARWGIEPSGRGKTIWFEIE